LCSANSGQHPPICEQLPIVQKKKRLESLLKECIPSSKEMDKLNIEKEGIMKKRFKLFSLFLALTFGIAFLPALSLGAEYVFSGPPAFTITYPDGSKPEDKASSEQVWAVKTPAGVVLQAGVGPMPPISWKIDLKDAAEKLYKPGLTKTAGPNIAMGENKEITLDDGTKAYYSELKWIAQPYQVQITTMLVSAYKDGMWVWVAGHPWDSFEKIQKIVKSLKFK
jgi:hypothetical protein